MSGSVQFLRKERKREKRICVSVSDREYVGGGGNYKTHTRNIVLMTSIWSGLSK